ncbi:MAG: hypothetical protein M3R38_01405 [Actinomycetota bacterium]|nr:hypothetical protein [Actinomycetota bacterium]
MRAATQSDACRLACLRPSAATVYAPPADAPPDLARLAELYDRSLLLDRCAERISRTAEGAMRLSLMRRRLLLSMRAAGLPESRWVRVGRRGLYLEPDPAARPDAPAYRLHAAPWAMVRFAPLAEALGPPLGRRALAFAAFVWSSVRRSAPTRARTSPIPEDRQP